MNEDAIIEVEGLTKTYRTGFQALKGVDLTISKGEIFALLGPNGAGKTTLISIVCGIVKASAGRVTVDGADVVRDYRRARATIGLVPQELTLDVFETVEATVAYSRGLFGKPRDPARVEAVLRSLSLWDKRKSNLMALSGGMKRRVMIAKALAHDPTILFLDEPTAGVDVDLRREMWALVRRLREDGVTVILTTHYIEEAEEMADRVGVIDKGQLVIVEEKNALIARLGRKRLIVEVRDPLAAVPQTLEGLDVVLAEDGRRLTYSFDARREENGIADLMHRLVAAGIEIRDLATRQTTLEEIFVGLVGRTAVEATMNWRGFYAIYRYEMARWFRTVAQSVIAPVVSTSLYFVVFGSAIGSHMNAIEGVPYAAFLVPGLAMLSILTQSVSNAAFGIYFTKWSGTIFELLSAPVSWAEAACGYVGAAATKSIILGAIIILTARLFVSFSIVHPIWMVAFLLLTAVTFSLLGFIIGIWAKNFEQLQIVPLLVVTPLTFLGGSFYSVTMLPPFWQHVSMANPVLYLLSGFRWSFYGSSDVGVGLSLAMTLAFLVVCLAAVWWIFRTGYKLKN